MTIITLPKKLIQGFSVIICFLFASISTQAQTPQNPTAARYVVPLEEALQNYEKIAANGGWLPLQIGKKIIEGENDPRIPTIRQILTTMGDYSDPQNISTNNDVLDKPLSEAVKKFQTRHGLEADGRIGAKTQSEMAISAQYRVAQIKATLEKMRETPDLGDRYILVNVAGFYLKAVDKNQLTINSRVIVGNVKNHTPLFHSQITEISFNPPWYVPPRIAREEIIKKQQKDQDFLVKGDYMVKNSDGEEVDVASVDWHNLHGETYRFIQRAGETSALGKIKFNLPDTDSIYLHSTGSPKLFAKSERALSHGCIRVELARDLAHFILGSQEGWNYEKINAMYDSNKSKIVTVSAPVPVHLVYWTSWVDEESKQPHFANDIYRKDKKRIEELQK
jgi:murein L,D-transpeptidase YcbB/YkuD